MGFGSYDESEQRTSEIDIDEREDEDAEEAAELHKHDHVGTVSFESGASTDDLVDRLGLIIEADDEEE